MVTASDQQARDLAVDVRRSIVCEAGAGSGKTALLVLRLLLSLASVNNPEEIRSVTFTRKAAGEMRNRTIAALRDVANGAIPTGAYEEALYRAASEALERDRELGWNVMDNPSRLRIDTFDSLAHQIVGMTPITSKLGGSVAIVEDAGPLYDRAIDRVFECLNDEEQPTLSTSMYRFFHLMDNRQPRAREFLKSLLMRRDQWLPHLLGAKDRHAFYHVLNESTVDLAVETMKDAYDLIVCSGTASALPQLWNYAASNGAKSPDIQALQGSPRFPELSDQNPSFWKGLNSLLLSTKGTFRKRISAAEGFPAPSKLKGEAKEMATDMKQLYADVIADLDRTSENASKILARCSILPAVLEEGSDALELLDILIDILPVLAAELNVVFANEGAADHCHVFQAALQAMGDELDPGEASLALDYQIKHILVDEYQDTSKPQAQLIRLMTAGWEQGDGRTLFIVGDPKQAIYMFREANVGNFLSARENGIGDIHLEPVFLTENFRSASEIIEWNNKTYLPAFPKTENIARSEVMYSPSTVPATAPTGSPVSVKGFVGKGAQIEEANHIAERVAEISAEHPEDSLAILVRNRSHLRRILPALRKHGLSWKASDIDPLASLGVVSDLLSLTRAIVNPMDKLAWMSVLRSPLLGLTVSDLHRVVGRRSNVWEALKSWEMEEFGEHTPIVERFISVMENTLSRYQRKPLRQLVEGAWVVLGGPSSAASFGDRDGARIFLDLVSQKEVGGTIEDMIDLENAVARLYASDVDTGNAAVEILTMHKAKGLQFDTVLLPGLASGSRPDEKELFYWNEWVNQAGEYRLAMAPIAPPGTKDVSLYDFLRTQEREKRQQELTRLLYVATTRPRKRLELTFSTTVDDEGSIRVPGSTTLIGSIWPSIEDEVEFVDGDSEQDEVAATASVAHVPADWQFNADRLTAPLAGFRGPEVGFGHDNVPELSWDNAVSRAAGTVFHRFQQQMIEFGQTAVSSDQTKQQRPFFENQLKSHGIPLAQLQGGCDIIYAGIAGLDTEAGRWILADHQSKVAELPVTVATQKGIKNLKIDLTFIEGGIRWIIDTKTSSPAPGESIDSFIARELNQYRDKMELYKSAVGHLGTEPVRMALFLPLVGRIASYDEVQKAA